MAEKAKQQTERLFIGVPLTENARRTIALRLPKILPGKAVVPENWHFTLRFLGATAAEVRDSLVAKLSAANLGSPFSVCLADLGAFPNPRRARILWLGVDKGANEFCALAKGVEAIVTNSGFKPEQRAFTPHLTLSRIEPAASVSALVASGIRVDADMLVDSIVLYRSRLSSGPPRYEELARFLLKP